MDNTEKKKALMRPLTMVELLPAIKALFPEDTIPSRALQKKPNPPNVQTQTIEKINRPLTGTEMRALLDDMENQTKSNKKPKPTPSTRGKAWNSSVKVAKTKNLTATTDNQVKCRTVRKVLNFQQRQTNKPEVAANTGKTLTNSVIKKSFSTKGKTKVPPKNSKIAETPIIKKPLAIKKPNISFKLNSNDSFLLKEKEINVFEEKCNLLYEEPLETIAGVSPLKENTSIQDDLSNTSVMDNSVTRNQCDKESDFLENNQRKESVIVSVCEVEISNNNNSKYIDLLESEKQQECDIKEIDNIMDKLKIMKETRLQTLHNIRSKLKAVQSSVAVEKDDKENLVGSLKNSSKEIKVKLPSYKIPRKSLYSTKNVICKSMPNISEHRTPKKKNTIAVDMYMEMKEQMKFLSTPLSNRGNAVTPDTPAITSHNLQKQLDELFS